ncbi:MAG: hypothetical protein OER22_05410 [Gammaproteobacteria bacterium]|nr:hypothetical protein [Gammaproteobacteria bacterium]MDH3372261.1 hypothetical protein [Gammaproteobacteria bacterium]MDH3410409.1 hypothetical protein [Gammaproteobacteria bacterium]MDH3552035.1 hypothetical protein [Gammaproteobacteria bacterium]
MTRLGLFQLRLAATVGLLLLVYALVRLLWYPGAYFTISGVTRLLLILVAVVLVIGPGLSALVYRPGKKGLVMDLGLLAVLEVVAVSLAVSQIHAQRPFYAVFAVDRFESVSRSEIDTTQITGITLQTRPGHEPRLVYAERPSDGARLDKLIDETLFEGKPDIDRRPEFWRPFPVGIPVLKAAASPLGSLLNGDTERAVEVRHWLSGTGRNASDYLYLPMRGKNADAMMILHADIGYPVDILAVDPW